MADLFAGLRARGHDVVLCGPQPPALLNGALERGGFEVLSMHRAVAPARDLETVRSFAGIVRRVRPDLIHAHSSKAGAIARLARIVFPRTPVLYTPHGYAMVSFFRNAERTLYREVERTLGMLTSRVLAVCEAEAQIARTVTAARRVTVVHNGVHSPHAAGGELDPRVAALRSKGPVVCTVCQLRPGKGIETLIDAWPAVSARHAGAQLAVAGRGALRDDLERRVRVLGVADSVHFLGESVNPAAVLRAADVFALASWFEAFPYAILDAMALGCSIVASDVGGVGEAIEHGRTGLLVPARNPAALSSALIDLIADAELCRRLGASALQAVGRFNTDAMVRGVLDAYDDTLDRARSA